MSTETKPPKRGRPPAENPLRARTIRVTDGQWECWQRAAGGNLNRWIRETLDRAAKRANR